MDCQMYFSFSFRTTFYGETLRIWDMHVLVITEPSCPGFSPHKGKRRVSIKPYDEKLCFWQRRCQECFGRVPYLFVQTLKSLDCITSSSERVIIPCPPHRGDIPFVNRPLYWFHELWMARQCKPLCYHAYPMGKYRGDFIYAVNWSYRKLKGFMNIAII